MTRPNSDAPFDDSPECADDESAVYDDDSAQPLCLNCMRPITRLAHFCEHCGETVGQLTPYIPFVNIKFYYTGLGRMWRMAFVDRDVRILKRILCIAVLFVLTPLLLLLVPFLILGWFNRPEPGDCQSCGYNLTGNTTGRCPKCGHKFLHLPGEESTA